MLKTKDCRQKTTNLGKKFPAAGPKISAAIIATVFFVILFLILSGSILKFFLSISAKTGIVWSGGGADDMCDAWILEQMAMAKIGISRYDWTKLQLSALDSIEWGPLTNLMELSEK